MTVDLRVLPAAGWAAAVAAELAARLRDEPPLRLCLPTGDTPSPMYAALADRVAAGDASLAEATVVQLDEYVGLPPTDAARCDGRLRRDLLDRLTAPPRRFHAVRVDELPAPAAAAAHDAVAAAGIDLALLGLGANGHVGLNEPGSTETSPTRVVQLTPASRRAARRRYGASSEPVAGVTLGMDRLLAADEIWLLVTGVAKADVLRQALEGPIGPDCPASFLRRHRRLVVIADEHAASAVAGEHAPPR